MHLAGEEGRNGVKMGCLRVRQIQGHGGSGLHFAGVAGKNI